MKQPTRHRLFNFWINEHDQEHPSGCMPILVMDVFEHAFMLDYMKQGKTGGVKAAIRARPKENIYCQKQPKKENEL